MPAAKLSTSGSLNAMNSEEGNDSLDTFIREAIGNEHILPLSRTFDNPGQWIQFLNAIDQPDLVGWPVITHAKPQMQKCDKCSLEFCSPINYRRHIRVHRRSLNIDKESHIKRDVLGAFWDKLSVEEAKEIVLFNGVMLKEIPGSSVVRGLASSLRKPGAWTLPQVYVRAGSSLVGIIQTRPPRLPISSQELFGILDEASERTFLCAGTAESLQKYLFDGETATSILELKNLVASTGFLFEQQLVKAWVADKDAHALRYQKLLVEEEEASKKRSAELSERKKQKKIRQKEHKLKEQSHQCKGDFNVANEFDATDTPVLAVASGPPSSPNSISNSKDGSANVDYCPESQQFQIKNSEDVEAQINFRNGCAIIEYSHLIGPPMVDEHGYQHLATGGLQVSNSQRHYSSDCTIEEDNQTTGSLMVGEQHDRQHLATSGLQVSNSQRHCGSDCTIEEDNKTIRSPMVGEQHDHQHLATSGLQVLNSQRHCSSDGTIEEDNQTIGSPLLEEQHDHQHLATSVLQVSNSQRHCSSDGTIEEDNQTIGSPLLEEQHDHQHLATSVLQVSNSQKHCSSDGTIEEDNQTIGSPLLEEQHDHQHLSTSVLQVSISQRHCSSDGTIEEDNQTIGSPLLEEQHDHQHLATSVLQVSNSQKHCSSDGTIEEDNQTIGSPLLEEQHDHQHLSTSVLQVSNSQRHCSSDGTIEEDSQTIGPPMVGEHDHQHLATSALQVSNSQRHVHSGCNVSQKIHNSKPESTQKNSLSKNEEIDSNEERLKASLQGEVCCKTKEDNCKVIIGSMTITVNWGATLNQQFDPSDGQGTSRQQPAIEKLSICDTIELDTNRIDPVTPDETKGIGAAERGDNQDCEGVVVLKRVGDQIVPGDCIEGVELFSSIVATAKEFMERRWKEAISGDHEILDLSSAS